ncbi:MAG: hypothetical protein KJO21_07045 [Verrucomicrobiae bacterium]|nr:hypothetical protein [Verrucomicrobiae bacterium]NNJ43873.1 hypothetical protein [Akkermansiaceae bacterium]
MRRQNALTLSTSTGRSQCSTRIHSSYSPDRWVHIASVYTSITTAEGDLDELYLFRGALSEQQIRQLMEENRVDSLTR